MAYKHIIIITITCSSETNRILLGGSCNIIVRDFFRTTLIDILYLSYASPFVVIIRYRPDVSTAKWKRLLSSRIEYLDASTEIVFGPKTV